MNGPLAFSCLFHCFDVWGLSCRENWNIFKMVHCFGCSSETVLFVIDELFYWISRGAIMFRESNIIFKGNVRNSGGGGQRRQNREGLDF